MKPRARRLVALLAVATAGCATLPAPRARPASEDDLVGWQALADGRRADAQVLFARRLAAAARDPIALFGRASIDYEQGASEAAIEGYVATLGALHEASDEAHDGAHGFGPLVAPVAAARVLTLFDEIGAAARRRTIERLAPLDLARRPDLPWLARVELLRLASHAAREIGDANELARVARLSGCLTSAVDFGVLGPLANADLDAAAPAAGRASPGGRSVTASSCRVDLPSTADGRGGARLIRMVFDGAGGPYDVVVDYPGEGRLSVDGGAARLHGSATRYGPRLSAARVALAAGRHELELRIAAKAGVASFSLYVLPASNVERAAAGTGPLADYCAAAIAQRLDATDDALAAVARLRARPRFALGLALAGAVAHDDPSRPASIARDAARSALRAAVGVDPDLARAWYDLATLALEDERPRDAIEAGRSAARAAPAWWAPQLLLARAFTARGLDFDANRAVEAAARKASDDGARLDDVPCPVIEALRRRAQDRRALEQEARLEAALVSCGGNVEARVERLRARGDAAGAIALLRAALRLEPERDDLAGDLAVALSAAGRHDDALAETARLVARDPNDPQRRLRLADAQAAAGQATAARETIAALLVSRPEVPEVQRAARALGVPLPLDGFRVDGRAIIRAFEAAAVRYTAPAVMVLDRAVMRIFPGGTVMTLTHQIVRVDSKDAVDKWAEIAIPSGAEILSLRTHKRDGSTREPEEIAGKETISAADVAIGDYIEWEYVDTRSPSLAFAPGFLVDRFFFQSFDAPMARSELLLVSPAGVEPQLDARAGAPKPQTRVAVDGTRITSFQATGVPQLFAERAAVPAIEYVPSVRASAGVDWRTWARYLGEEFHDTLRSSPEVREQARRIAERVPGGRRALAAAVVDWVTTHIESTDELADPASFALARGRGSRTPLVLALARELGVPARPVLVRSRLVADASASLPPQELDDFADVLVEMDVGAAGKPELVCADVRLRHAAFGYLPPGLDGARMLRLPDGDFGVARKTAAEDRRTVDMTIRLDEQGGGVAVATEDLAGWPALEWAELVERFGADRARLRQDFEQRWLGVQFPGARLRELEIDVPTGRAAALGTAHVRYSFSSARLAVPTGRTAAGADEMRIAPTFFRSQPGRRFAAEPQRATALMLGFDVPTRITATVELPRAARIDEASLRKGVVIARAGGYRFVEDRQLRSGGFDRPNVIVLRRESELPIMRVSPSEYADVAADLRRVDGAEQEEIRIPPRGAQPRGGAMTDAFRRALWAGVLGGVFALAAGGCQSGKGGASSDRLVVARPTDAVSLDPARTSDIESLEVAEQVYGRLVRFSAGRLEPEADLATSWTVSSDGTIWTFELRPNVRFHDGTPLDADAVVFSFERQIVPEHPAHEADFVWARAYHNIRHVRAAGPLSVQFEIDRPYAPFLANLAMGPAAIVSPTAVRKWKRDFGRHPVGAGPYRFVEWIPGDRITLERNPDYWDELARTRYLVLIAMPDSRQRLQALESGAADVIQQLAPDDLPLVRLNPDLALAMAPATLVSYLAMNTQRRPLNDLRIRRAIAHAVNRDALVKLVYQGLGIPAIGPLPPNVWGARSDVVTYPYDPPRARKLLAEAGWQGDREPPLKLFAPSVASQYMPAPARVAGIIKKCLGEVGISVDVILSEPADHQRALWAGEHDLALHGWFNDNGDPDNFLYTLLDSDNTTGTRPSNIAFYSNAWFHDVIGMAQRTTDPKDPTARTERERLYSQAQAILAIDVPWVPLAHSKVVFAQRAALRGLVVQPSAMGLYRWAEHPR